MLGTDMAVPAQLMASVRVLLVDDHTVVRRGLRRILEAVADIEVVGEAGNGVDAVQAAADLQPDVVLMDVSLPLMNGIEAARQISASSPDTRVLMLSMHAEEQYVEQSLAAGAHGYVVKDAEDQDLVGAVMAVAQGDTYLPPRRPGTAGGTGTISPTVLSPRELQVLALICSGQTNREMAAALRLSPNTIETHRKHIIEKLDLHSTADLVRYAIRNGLV
jgi:two-component system response regulator NreC